MNGWAGTILRVNLTEGKVLKQPLNEEIARNFIGGRGLNSKTLFDEIKPGIDPLGSENILCLAVGPLTGTSLPLTSRIEVSTLSPYSGILGDGNAGGEFPALLKLAGYDQIVITGQAEKPVYLWIDDAKVELRDAADLWGKTTWETTDILKKRHGEDIGVMGIGQAGENLVRFASTICDKHGSAARGSGAVWGSKRLKAIAVRGTGEVQLADPDELKKLASEDKCFFESDPIQVQTVAKYGTHVGMLNWGPAYKNFEKYLSADECPELYRPEEWKKYEIDRCGCRDCPVKCKNVYKIPDGEYKGETGWAMEFECIACLGTNSGITDNPTAVMVMENLADKYGMCVIGLGNSIAFVKDLYNRGIITEKDTGGLKLDWDNAETQIELIHQTALRQGFGNIVAEGLFNIAKIIGGVTMDYCYHVKGLSRGPWPAGIFSLAHATSTRGADHLRGRTWAYGENDPEAFPQLVKLHLFPADLSSDTVAALTIAERVTTLTDAIGRCKGAVTSWVAAVAPCLEISAS